MNWKKEAENDLKAHEKRKAALRSLAEEIADVQIMLEQMELLHDCEGLVAGFKAQSWIGWKRDCGE